MKQKSVRLMLVLTVVVLAGIWPCSVSAGWLDKGTQFFKSLSGSNTANQLSVDEISAGLKEALKVGSQNVVAQLGTTDGFNKDENIHIPLPQSLDTVKNMLNKIGMAYLFEDLELKLNRAAELATPRAKQLFMDAISQMTLEDVKGVYNGPDDAATRYFEGKMSGQLAQEMKPVIENTLSEVGAVKAYDTMMKKYTSLPFVPDVKANLTGHVVEKGMDGIFYYMAKEEAAIRKDPVKRTTELLKKVFDK